MDENNVIVEDNAVELGSLTGFSGGERGDAAQKLHESQLELLASSIPGGLAVYGLTEKGLKMLYFNDGYYSFSGYSRAEYAKMIADDPLGLLFDEDKPGVRAVIKNLIASRVNGGVNEMLFRCHAKGGGYRWVNLKTVLLKLDEDNYVVNVVQLDVTDQQEEKERLRLHEEEYRLAAQHSGRVICRYSIPDRTLKMTPEAAKRLALPECIPDVPYGRVKLGKISADTADAYIAFYESIITGSKDDATVTFKKLLPSGWRWISAHATAIRAADGSPLSAIISYADVTDQLEKETLYRKWQQALLDRKPESYTLYRVDLNRNTAGGTKEGSLLDFQLSDETAFNERTKDFAESYVAPEDRARYLAFVDSDKMLASYYRGKRAAEIEFRGKTADGTARWLSLSVELVESPYSSAIEAYLMYEDIDERKTAELQTKELAESDPLTGLLNRVAFAEKMGQAIAGAGSLSALLMLDMDGFKQVNDTLGHAAGDQVLIDAAQLFRSHLRKEDLVCRFGGDEFLVCLRNMPDRGSILMKAQQLCAGVRRSLGLGVSLSVSLGIALCPEDGTTFEELYHKADKALYYVKGHGKNNCAFYSDIKV